jgi:hypothetical protein
MIAIQYLEDNPDIPGRDPAAVVEKLRAAAGRIPISHLLIGWHLPARLLEACRMEAVRLGMRFMRWHPLLTGEHVFQPGSTVQVIGAGGHPVPGYGGKPEFTFACPNHPEVREAVSRCMKDLLKEGLYQGFFLDRVRFPSPGAHPVDNLGCFCEHCRQRAAIGGLDLEQVRKTIVDLDQTAAGRLSLVQTLLGGAATALSTLKTGLLRAFLAFRVQSVNELAAMLSRSLRPAGVEIGLDCFSPSLTGMVGQDLGVLSAHADWIKVMSYAHARGPAGIPFELAGFFDYLSTVKGLDPARIPDLIGRAIDLPLPATCQELVQKGISSTSLEMEVRRGVQASWVPLLAGFELVENKGISELNDAQILADLEAVQAAGAAGLVLSWDLWDILLERLNLVRRKFG